MDETAAFSKEFSINWTPSFEDHEFFAPEHLNYRLDKKHKKPDIAEQRFKKKISEAFRMLTRLFNLSMIKQMPEEVRAKTLHELYSFAILAWNLSLLNNDKAAKLYMKLAYENSNLDKELLKQKTMLLTSMVEVKKVFLSDIDALILRVEYNFDGQVRVYSYFDETKKSFFTLT